ncbi:MAG: FctA domain-containing protein, partial [Eubacteriales bacterium]|nr:FctA domain-containing protein [Eubacteriales bacterium]
GDSSHVTYDDTVYNVTASVTDDFQGKLHVEWNCGVKSISFHNVYTATPVSVNPDVVKEITGDTPKTADTFRFALSGVSVNSDADTMPPMPEGSEDGAKTIDIEGEGTGYFGPITFEKAGTYRYQVVELTGQNPRYTYDTTTYQLTYVVKDQDGTLKAEAAIESTDGSAESLVFSNQYTRSTVKLEGDAAITVQKQLTGRSMLQGEKFSFTMKPADDQTKTAIEKGDIKIADDTASVEGMHKGETATVSFGSVEFAEEGEYTFQVQEKDGGKAGMTYDTEAKTLKVKVTSENDTLKAVQENVPAFKNRYKAEGNFTPAGTKTLLSAKGNKLNIKDGQFTFEVRYLQDSNGEPVATGTTKSGKDAAIDFGTLSYSTSELKTLIQKGYADEAETDNGAEYYIDYLVTEKDTGNDALQKNSEAQTFRVVLKDDGTGKLTASSEDGKNLKFQNRYVTDTAVVSMDGHKVLNGRPLSDGEFTFLISSDDANAPMPKQTEVKNTTSGSVSFGNITFTKDDLEDADSKTFTYKITESGTQPGVTNDSETKTVKVKVTDDGKGHIKAETESGAAPLFAFTNNYKPVSAESSVSDSLKVKKILKGRDLKEGEFHFVMKDADGKEVATATNKADGIIQFQAQKFTEAGTYNYTIEEVSGDLDRVTYDETVHHVTAVVTDSYDGKPLSVTWNAGETAVEFHNVYTPKSDNPSKPGKDDNGTHGNGGHANGSNGGNSVGNSGSGSQVSSHTPQTGDDENTGFFLGLMGISAAMLAGITGLRKKFALKK